MPIGTGKVGLFGGVVIEAGSETFNAPGTFTVPADLKIVTLSGNGSTSNAGNPGNPGGDGIGGAGGAGGAIPTLFAPSTPGSIRICSDNCPAPDVIGVQRSLGGIATGPAPSPWCPFINPPGGPGNPGNPGGVTSAFGYCWTGGTAGNGGTGGIDGAYGTPGLTGPSFYITNGTGNAPACTNVPAPSQNTYRRIYSYNGGSGGTGAFTGGIGGGAGVFSYPSVAQCPCNNPFVFRGGGGIGGHGGGGAPTCGNGIPATSLGAPLGRNHGITYGTNMVGPTAPGNSCWTGVSNGSMSGGTGGRGGSSGLNDLSSNPNTNNTLAVKGTTAGIPSPALRSGAGGGGGGAGGYTSANASRGAAGTGGGGGGSGSAGNPGSGAGNPGNPGIPATFSSIPVTEGCYPIQVGVGGQITISWNAQ